MSATGVRTSVPFELINIISSSSATCSAPVSIGRLDRDHALAAAPLGREFVRRRPFAVAMFRCRQNHAGAEHAEGDNLVVARKLDTPDPGRAASHGTNVLL